MGPAAAVHPVRAEAMRVLGDDDPDRFFFFPLYFTPASKRVFFFLVCLKGKRRFDGVVEE